MFKPKAVDQTAREGLAKVQESLDTIRRELRQFQDLQAELHDKLQRLRGKVYAHKMHLPDEESQGKETKAELLRRAGFVPGRPMVHKDG